MAVKYDEHYNDSPRDMLLGRRIARFLSNFSWYLPNRDSPNKPVLDEGWAYFEHHTLERYAVRKKDRDVGKDLNGNEDTLQKVRSGEDDFKTRLYPLTMKESQLADFGLGIGLYFSMLRILAGILFIAFLINLPLFFHYSSEDYDGLSQQGVDYALKGSAICTDHIWKPCPNCTSDDWTFPRPPDRYAESVDNPDIKFILVNNCTVGFSQGIYNWIAFLFVFASIVMMEYVEQKKQVALDESNQTAQDYTISVTNPPKDSRDPDEWNQYFSKIDPSAHVTVVTVAIDNEELIDALVLRKSYLIKFENLLGPGVEMPTEKTSENLKPLVESCVTLSWFFRKCLFYPDAETIVEKLEQLEQLIKKLSEEEPNKNVSDIFVTFEKEEQQRTVLKKMRCARLNSIFQSKMFLPSSVAENLFRDKHILNIVEATGEPSSIRWEDLDESLFTQIIQQIITFIITLIMIVGGAYLITLCEMKLPYIYSGFTPTALMITFLNSATPMVVRFIMTFESHRTEGSRQSSEYLKMCLFRWTSSAIVLSLIIPFTSTITNNQLLKKIYSIFFTEIIYTPVSQLSDFAGQFYRHYQAPRAKNDRQMKLCFQGTSYSLAERYTNVSKVLFVTFYYGAVFPSIFAFSSASLVVHYIVDKFCILRSWAKAPELGLQLAKISNRYLFSAALVSYVILASYSWSGFPYDNACLSLSNDSTDNVLPDKYIGNHTINDINGNKFEGQNVVIDEAYDGGIYSFCNQDLLRERVFLTLYVWGGENTPWMSDGQTLLVKIFGVTGIIVVIFLFSEVFIKILYLLRGYIIPVYKPTGKSSDKPFSKLNIVSAYIPMVNVPGNPHRFFLCDVGDIKNSLLDVECDETEQHHPEINLIYDIPWVKEKYQNGEKISVDDSIFTIAKYYEPSEESKFEVDIRPTTGLEFPDGGSPVELNSPSHESETSANLDSSQENEIVGSASVEVNEDGTLEMMPAQKW